uniref:Prephenate dehydratase domain-containing protein n=1 Tax=Daucus carota subsp. sativus TaxID=79200 RepID=A0A166F488_DAUCS
MSLKTVPIWVCANHSPQHSFSQLGGVSDLVGAKRCRFVGYARMECFSALSAQRAKTPVEDDKPLTKPLDSIDVSQLSQSVGFHKDLNSLPKPLTATDLTSSPNDGSKVRVAYQGVPGAYSEAAALKAYPKCETVPCDQFEAAFKALDQCEMTLNKLGVVRVSYDDTAGAAQVIAADGIRDTGAVASSRAAEIYGLDILAERMQLVAIFDKLVTKDEGTLNFVHYGGC